MAKINDDLVKGLEPPESGNRVTWENGHKDAVTGFGVRITKNGVRSFILRYVFEGTEYRHTIGTYPTWSVSAARAEAKDWRVKIDRGDSHPLGAKRDARDTRKKRAEAMTYAEAVRDYVKREQEGRKQNATSGAVQLALLRDGADWKDKPLVEVTSTLIRRKLEAIRDGDPKATPPIRPRGYTANRFHAYLSTFFRWAAEPGVELVPSSPMIGLRRPWDGEEARDRTYSDAEIKALWKAGDTLGGVPGAFLKVAILTGKRRGALAAMRWVDISEDGIWSPPPDTRLKKRTKRLHGVPLPRLAQRVIAPLRPKTDDVDASPYVFPGRSRGTHLDAGSPFRQAVKEASGIPDYITHALRHTLETRLAEMRVPPHVRDAALDHVPMRGSGASYDHWSYTPEIRDALERWADHIEALVSPAGAKVLR
jgi:integrase